MKPADNDADRDGAHRLASLMDLESAATPLWTAAELGAVFRHQMSAPVQLDLGGVAPNLVPKLRFLCEAQGLLLNSFDDLFRHPHPPVELFEIVKKWARRNRQNPAAALPKEVATALYYGSIAAALVRCQRQISRLGDPALKQGLDWMLAQQWITDPVRSLCQEARSMLMKKK
ncbi:MAG: hypothetical protein WC708_09205 [Lentisphaeria bacterium]